VTSTYVIGYDPGGRGANGVAVLRVDADANRWIPRDLTLTTLDDVDETVEWITRTCSDDRIVAAGADTLTEWSSAPAGARPADLWLKSAYRDVAAGVLFPVALRGAMTVNGAAFLLCLRDRFHADQTMVTEAHPTVCYRALTGVRAKWKDDRTIMAAWLIGELGVGDALAMEIEGPHGFDAAMAALAALRGLNGEWRHDLHALPHGEGRQPVRYFGRTHYWWPE
jgi:hypothetical protein